MRDGLFFVIPANSNAIESTPAYKTFKLTKGLGCFFEQDHVTCFDTNGAAVASSFQQYDGTATALELRKQYATGQSFICGPASAGDGKKYLRRHWRTAHHERVSRDAQIIKPLAGDRDLAISSDQFADRLLELSHTVKLKNESTIHCDNT